MFGVVEILSGLLIRAGYCDFTTDGSFDSETEAQHADVPKPFWLVDDDLEPDSALITHWTGTEWDLVPRV